MKQFKISLIACSIIFILSLPLSYSNGGCIKITDDIFVQLSISPLVPIVDKQESFLISFGGKNGLINEEIAGKLRINKKGEAVLAKDFKINDGILDLKHTFKSAGLYEIFLDFNIGSKRYTPEDFLIEVKEEESYLRFNILFLLIGIIIGIVIMKLTKKYSQKPKIIYINQS